MPLIQRELRMMVSHFSIGDYIEYGWFRGEVVGLNCNSLQQIVRVCEVLIPAAGRTVGETKRVPFNLGREYVRPGSRNYGKTGEICAEESDIAALQRSPSS